MSKILLKSNETTGVETFYESSGETERMSTTQNVDDILDYAAEMRATTAGERYGELRRVTLMPMSVVGQALREGWLFDQARVRAWSRENPKFKTFDKGF